MNCSEFRNWIEDIEASRDIRAASSHIDHCADPRCRSLWEEFLLVEDAIAAWKKDVPRSDLMERVWREVERPVVAVESGRLAPPVVAYIEKRTNSRRWIVLVLSLAVVAIGLWGLTNLNRPGSQGSRSAPIANQPAVVPSEPEPPLQRYSVASVNLAQTTSAFVADAALLTVQDVGDPDDPSRPVSAWATRVSRQLEPLGENINKAVEFIDKVIPDMSMMQMMPTS